jgi:cytochrome c6
MKKILLVVGLSTLALVIPGRCEDAKALYDSKCAACHGKEGKGDTKMGQKLEVRDYTDAKVQAALKDEDMAKGIKEGVKDGDKSKMKGFGDKLTDEQVKSLVAYMRSFKK